MNIFKSSKGELNLANALVGSIVSGFLLLAVAGILYYVVSISSEAAARQQQAADLNSIRTAFSRDFAEGQGFIVNADATSVEVHLDNKDGLCRVSTWEVMEKGNSQQLVNTVSAYTDQTTCDGDLRQAVQLTMHVENAAFTFKNTALRELTISDRQGFFTDGQQEPDNERSKFWNDRTVYQTTFEAKEVYITAAS